MKTAFRATGIHPLDRGQVLKRMPGGAASPAREEVYRRVSESFVEQLQTKRYGEEQPLRRGRTLRLSPGKSYAQPSTSSDSPGGDGDEDVDDPDQGTSSLTISWLHDIFLFYFLFACIC